MKLPSVYYRQQIKDGGIQDGGIQDGGIQDGCMELKDHVTATHTSR